MPDTIPDAKPASAKAPALPAAICLTEQYGYWTDDAEPVLRMWFAGAVVTDAAQIADLAARLAPFDVVPQ